MTVFQRGDVWDLYVFLNSNFNTYVHTNLNDSGTKFKLSWGHMCNYCWKMLLNKRQSKFVQKHLPWNLLNKIASTNNQSHRFNAATYACFLTCSGALDWCRWTFNVEKCVANPPPELFIRKIRILKIEKFAVELYDLNRFKSIFCNFLRILSKNQVRHRQKNVDDSEHVPLSYGILYKRFLL